jgi:hypothetical protein
MKRLLLIISLLFLILFSQSHGQTISIPPETSFPCQTVSFPVVASGFPVGDVGAITLYINVEPGVIGYLNNTPGTISGYGLGYDANLGQIIISWSFNPTDPPTPGPNVNGTLLTINFQYYGGLDTLKFVAGCEISSIGPPAEDIPTTYINGLMGPMPETIYYVDSTVITSGNGLSWGTALKKISEATNKPLKAGDKVLIKPYHYNDTVIIKSNGIEVVPLTFNVTVSDTNKITFPVSSDFSCLDFSNYPGKYYAYLGRSWKGNNGVYKITQVNKTSKYVIVEGAEFVAESGGSADSSLLQASIGLPITYEKYSSNPQTERVVLSSSGISGERAALHIGKPTSAGDFNVNAANYNIIDGIDITGADQVGVRIQNSKFNVYKNSRIYELDSLGIMISGNTANPANNNFILKNRIYNARKKAVKVGIQSETPGNNKANLNHIKGNEIYSTTGANINYINAIDICHYTGFTVIESNTFRNFKLTEINRGVIELKNSVRRVLAYSNFIKNIDRVNASNTHSIFYLQVNGNNNKVFNNVIVDSASVANDIFAFWVNGNGGYTAGLIAYNSVHKVDNGFKLESGSTGVDFIIKDNIMNLDPTTPEQFATTGTGTYNVSYNCYSTLPGAYPTETGRLVTDPLFLLPGNYQSPFALSLQSSSPCMNSGNPISGIVTDFRKKTRNPSSPSRGSFEQVLSNIFWTGEMNTNWHDYHNWDVQMVPSSIYNTIIPDRLNDPLVSTGSASCKSLQVQPGALLKVQPPGSITIYP